MTSGVQEAQTNAPTHPWVRRVLILLVFVLLVVGYDRLLPLVLDEPALRARVAADVLQCKEDVLLSDRHDPRILPVEKVVKINDGLRLRAVSNSHHNNYITYGGSTYVNVNNKVFYRTGGHCGASFFPPLELSESTTEEELVAALLEAGYRRLP